MPTLLEYRRRVGALVGGFDTFTVDAGTRSGIVCNSPPIKSNLVQDDYYKDSFLYWTDAPTPTDKVRRVSAYTPSSGTLIPDLPYSVAPVGGHFELYAPMHPEDVNECINEALKRILIQDEFTLIPQADTFRQSLASQPWLTNPDYIYQVGCLQVGEDRDKVDPYNHGRGIRGMVERIGPTLYLNHYHNTFNPTTTILYVLVMKPAYYACATADEPTYDHSGLNADTDSAIPDLDWVAYGAIMNLIDQQKLYIDPNYNSQVFMSKQEAVNKYNELTITNHSEPERTFKDRPIMMWGPRR